MKPEGHKKKAMAFEFRAGRWEYESEAPSVIEDIFDAIVHYIAYALNIKYGRDIDSHQAQKRFLKEHGENEIYNTYNDVKAWTEISGKKV